MSPEAAVAEPRQLRAPLGDREALLFPSADEVPALWRSNRRLFHRGAFFQLGDSAPIDRQAAQRELIDLAASYSRRYRDVDFPRSAEAGETQGILLTGHQPQLFHPGVLYKHFVLDRFARQLGAVPVSLVMDNDLCGSVSIAAPAGSRQAPHFAHVHFDGPGPIVPFESRSIVDRDAFRHFARRVSQAMQPWLDEVPLAEDLWRHQPSCECSNGNLGYTLAAMRHRWEATQGLQSLEVPLSQVCQTISFCQYVAALVIESQTFAEAHNAVLAAYRQAHKVRSPRHPVPALESEGEYVESPFWIWHRDAPTRRRLFVAHQGRKVRLTDRANARLESSADRLAECLHQWQLAGWAIRPRALTSTLYGRLVLSDLFIHGIGGSKYDRLTDAIIKRMWGDQPPGFLTVTATMRLPIDRGAVTEGDRKQLRQAMREAQFHPETLLSPAPDEAAAEWIEQKRQWIAAHAGTQVSRQAHRRLEQINQQLRQHLERQRQELAQRLRGVEQELAASRILNWREYSFALFPPRLGQWLRELARRP